MAEEGAIIRNLTIGSSRAALAAKPKSPLAQLIQLQVQEVIERLRDRMNHYNVDASGNLQQGIKLDKVQVSGSSISVPIEADFYWKFVNFGVNGSERSWGAPAWGSIPNTGLTFSQSIDNWIRDRGITLPAQFDSYESLNFVIRRSIKEKGKEPRPFFSDVVNDALTREMRKPLEKLIGRTIEIVIVEPWQ